MEIRVETAVAREVRVTNERSYRVNASPEGRASSFDRRALLRRLAGTVVASGVTGSSALAQTEATPSTGQRPISLPALEAVGPAGLVALLSCVPDSMLNRDEGSVIHWYYADIAQQFDALGLRHDAGDRRLTTRIGLRPRLRWRLAATPIDLRWTRS